MSSYEPSTSISSLSSSDAKTLLEIIHRSLSCDSEEKFIVLFDQITELLPFDYAVASLGCLDNNEVVIVHNINISFPEEWLYEYSSKNFITIDAYVKENFRAYTILDWSDSTKKKLNEPKEITSLCKDFDMRKGYMHGSRPLSMEKYGSMFSFSSKALKYDKRNEAILELVTPHLHLALINIFNKRQTAGNKDILSCREREVLNWLRLWKSSWDISVILGISERTVNFHVCNIMRKLGASKRHQAVAVAAHLGMISID